MAIFNYRAIDKVGKEIKGTLNSDSVANAKIIIKSKGLLLLDISESSSDPLKQKSESSFNFSSGVSIEDLSLMVRQMSTLIKAKIQIVECLTALVEQTENPRLKVILSEIKQKVNEGCSLANAFNNYPKVFDNIFVNMVDAGEASGNLEIVLLRLAEFTEAQRKLKNKIIGAMLYPIIMMSVGSLVISGIFLFIIPKITKMFVTMKKELPLPTKVCIWISESLQSYWWLIIILAIISIYAFKKYIATPKGKEKWHNFLLKFPILGKIITMINVSRFTSTLATLLNSGVPILVAMKIVSNIVSNVHIKKAIEMARDNVSEGASMAGPLVQSHLFPPMVTHMITLGERSGELSPMLKIISESYEEQVDTKLTGLTSILEPIMIVVMGVVIMIIVLSVVLPMMELNSLK